MSPPLLLFLVNDTRFFLSHRLNIALAARAEGWRVYVASPTDKYVDELKQYGLEHRPWELSRYSSNPFRELGSLLALYRLFRQLRPTIVHAVTIKPVLYAGFIAPMLGVKGLVMAISGLGQVFTSTSRLAKGRKWAVKSLYILAFRHRNSKVIVQNPDDAKELRFALREHQSVLIPGAGVEPDEFKVVPIPAGIPIVILAGRLLWAKGVGVFVDAARQVRGGGREVRFAIVGEPDEGNPDAVPRPQLERWEAEGVIEWWGRRSDMPEVLGKASVVCSPTYYGEGIPRILIEAAFSGRPIIATDWPGCREIVVDGKNGLLVEPRNPASLAAALNKVLASKELREEFSKAGRRIALSRFTSAEVTNRTMAVYRNLLGNDV